MAKKVIIFRVSKWFLNKINEFCKNENLSYSELFKRAVKHLENKYSRGDGDNVERKENERKDS
jgi:hypothetical protein